MWVNYVNEEEGTPPGPIINDMVFYNMENEQEMWLGKDILLVSTRIWETFFDWYGGGPTLKWKFDINESANRNKSGKLSKQMSKTNIDESTRSQS